MALTKAEIAETLYDELGLNTEKIVGTCERLEKDYYRLTCAPKAADVRPLRVLEKALNDILTRWGTGDIIAAARRKATDGGKKESVLLNPKLLIFNLL